MSLKIRLITVAYTHEETKTSKFNLNTQGAPAKKKDLALEALFDNTTYSEV